MIIGHKEQWDFLKKGFLNNSLSHAYLFSGLDYLGKKQFALEFAKMANCQEKEKPCGFCHNCKMISKNSFPDFLFIEPEAGINDQSSIQISQIRKLQNFLSYRPYISQFKIVVINKADKMNSNAQSCLLKTLEEPKGKVVLILVSSYPEMLLSTVLSRCELVKFFYVKNDDIKKQLLKNEITEKEAEIISKASKGKPGKAIDFLLNPQKIKEEKLTLQKGLEALDSDFVSRFNFASNLISEKRVLYFLNLLQDYLRFILMKKIGLVDNENECSSFLTKKFENYSLKKIKKAIEEIEIVNFLISSTNINTKLALENLLIKI